MKKKVISKILLVVSLCTVVFVQSCKKEDSNPQRFYATIQQYDGDKMHISTVNGYSYSCWDDGDQVQLHSWTGTVHLEQSTGRYYIDFENQIVQLHDGTSYANHLRGAIYPYELWQTSRADPGNTFNVMSDQSTSYAINRMHFRATQLYQEASNGSQKVLAPMVAVWYPADDYTLPNTDNIIEFKNICALLKVTVSTSTPIVVTRITVENSSRDLDATNRQKGRPLWGNFEITFEGDSTDHTLLPILREQSNTNDLDYAANFITKEVTLECEHHGDQGGVSVTSSHPFYIYLPPVGYKDLHITVYAKDVSTGTERCTTLTSTVEGAFLANYIYPLSVSYSASWTAVPSAHTLGPYTVDAYGRQVNFSFSNLHKDNQGYFFPPYQYDFIGYNDPNYTYDHFLGSQLNDIIGTGGFAPNNGYTVLTNAEWQYLLGREGNNFAHALVASVPGIILFPDNYTPPSSIISSATINHTETDYTYTDNVLSIADFYQLENDGCVFLPCVSYTSGDAAMIQDVGNYWTQYGFSNNAYSLAVGNIGMTSLGNYDQPAYIRLVQVISSNK